MPKQRKSYDLIVNITEEMDKEAMMSVVERARPKLAFIYSCD